MNFYCYAQYAMFLLIVVLLVKPAGAYMARVFSGERTRLDPILGPLERAFYRLCGVNPKQDMSWRAREVKLWPLPSLPGRTPTSRYFWGKRRMAPLGSRLQAGGYSRPIPRQTPRSCY